MNSARRLLDLWHKVECWIAVVAFGFIAVILLLDVLGRELLGPLLELLGIPHGPTGIFAAQRFSIFALVIGAFVGIGVATATGSHLVPRVGFGWIPAAWGPTMDRVADVITGAFLIFTGYVAAQYVQSTFASDLRTPVLGWPIWPIQLALPLGFVSAGVRYLVFAAWPELRPKLPEFQE